MKLHVSFRIHLQNGGSVDYRIEKASMFERKCPDEGRVIVLGDAKPQYITNDVLMIPGSKGIRGQNTFYPGIIKLS